GMMPSRRLGLRKIRRFWLRLRQIVPTLTSWGRVWMRCLRGLIRVRLSFQAWANRWMFLTLSWGIITSIRIRARCIRSRGFKLAITSEIIGKLGGRVEATPVSSAISGVSTKEILHTVEIPPGETWLVAVIGNGTSGTEVGSNMPRIAIGDTRVPQSTGHFASATIMTESGDVVLESNSKYDSDFTGHVYTVKM